MRTRLLLPLASLLPVTLAFFACGGISNPNNFNGPAVATVSGSLNGATAAPSDAHVAIVWRTKNGLAVGADTALTGGSFSLALTVPPDEYFSDANGGSASSTIGGGPVTTPPSAGSAPGSSTSGSAGSSSGSTGTVGGRNVSPLDGPSGTVTSALQAAVAGFVLYEDANGNGRLDLQGSTAASPDHILGGNRDLVLVYFRGGGRLDYEALRDKLGGSPVAGFNLAYNITSSNNGRWLGLDLVELKLSDSTYLPSAICSGVPTTTQDNPPVARHNGYPDPSDPNLKCSADGTSFSYNDCPPAPPKGLCSNSFDSTCGGYGEGLAQSTTSSCVNVPVGWPCKVTNACVGATDAGAGPVATHDAGGADATTRGDGG